MAKQAGPTDPTTQFDRDARGSIHCTHAVGTEDQYRISIGFILPPVLYSMVGSDRRQKSEFVDNLANISENAYLATYKRLDLPASQYVGLAASSGRA